MRDPALVFVAVLVRAVNAAHAKHERGQSIGASVVSHVLIGRAFRAAIRTMEIERAAFVDASLADSVIEWRIASRLSGELQIGEIAVDFVRGCKNERRRIIYGAYCFEQIQRTTCID